MTETAFNSLEPSGRLCLDFINTVHWREAAQPVERLGCFADLVEWARQMELLSPSAAREALERARTLPDQDRGTLRHAMSFRETLYRIFIATIRGQAPEPADLEVLTRMAGQAAIASVLVPHGSHFVLRRPDADADLDSMLATIAVSAMELLTSPDLRRVRQCADDRGCGLLFFDSSKNQTRRWCSMGICGNRAKRRRNYHRHRR
ncbi:CGNR zinc finger domain-containing protein [Rhodoligotrophos defluvii]|uniref:CGNR zinc finger domain-containing protein n=1 Tax=Rhodoligotrophos defluvii TaxID=2561934 RepID=UPI0010C9D119|nr:ABATE domain-containing protein [Rhodoligotrophos defluvii]